MAWHLMDRCRSYIEPWQLVRTGLWGVYESAKEAFRNGRYHILFSWSALQESGFYLWYKTSTDTMIRFESEHTPVPHLVPACSGVVLELGPGAGNQLFRFDKAKVTRIVGVESNPLFAPDLQRQIRANGLEGVYDVIVPARFGEDDAAADEELARQGIVPGSVDTVLSVQVLCSVSDPQRAMREVYRLLKPGGRFIFWEHTRSEDLVTRVVQYLWNPLWTRVIGGCRLTRDTRSVIESAGEWKNIESIESDELPWSMVPRMWGVLVKPEPS